MGCTLQIYPPIYLVELFDPFTGEIINADVFARMDTAVETALIHSKKIPSLKVHAEVSTDVSGGIDGFGFFDEDHELVACITVSNLTHDKQEPQLTSVRSACLLPPAQMQAALNTILYL